MSKKNIFDMLENAEDDSMEELTKNCPDMSKAQFEKLFAATERRYNMKKAEIERTKKDNIYNNNSEATVSGVERVKINMWRKPLLAAASFIIVAGTVLGTVSLMKGNKPVTPDLPPVVSSEVPAQKAAESTTKTTEITTVTSGSTAKATTTITTAVSTSAVTNTASNAEETVKAVETEVTATETETETISANTGITQEELDSAAARAIEKLINDNPGEINTSGTFFQLKYAFYDVNEDSVPELFVNHSETMEMSYMYVYDGTDYAIAHFNGHDMDGNEKVFEVKTANINIFNEKNTIGMLGRQAGSQSFILHMSADNTITPVYEYTLTRSYRNGSLSEEYQDEQNFKKYDSFWNEYDSYGVKELNWIQYDIK